ncbi:MAG: TIGR02186 family protein [Methylobacterium frigidaeris]
MRAGLALAALLTLGVVPARAETLVVGLSFNRMAINSTYAGASVAVFGAIERDGQSAARSGDYDVVVTIRGPRRSLTVREKDALGPVWLNRRQRKFGEVPVFLAVASSRPLDALADAATRRRLRLGLDAIIGAPELTLASSEGEDPFRSALLRLRKDEGLFIERPAGVRFLSSGVFQANLPLPAGAPVGSYEVEVALLAGGTPLATRAAGFDLVKTGFEQRMAAFARDWSPVYGLAAAALALLSGWLASVIFRRD